ncbi:caspase family protein [Candidatus Bathyarchaeota archaeon]|nr:caspase family protein [Candidatus Bathyarchaeota archaeon]
MMPLATGYIKMLMRILWFLYFLQDIWGIEKDLCGIEKDKLAKYLLPFDSVVDNIFASAISNRDFNGLLLAIKSKKLVIFMDSCYSGGVSERGARDVKIMDDPYQKLAEGEGRLVIAASQPNQLSYENSEIEHGVFTDNLLKALSGAADWDNDGYVKVLDAWKYLQETVPKDAMKLAGEIQEPILRGDIKKDFVISIDRERFEKIEKEKVLEEKLGKLDAFYDEGNLSGKQYEYLRALLKIDPGELKDKNKKIVKRINDLLSGNISITTFLENLEVFEPELFGIPEKKRQEKDRQKVLREEEEHKAREKQLEKERRNIEAREKAAKEAQEIANRLEQENLQRQKEEEERAQKDREEKKRIAEEKEPLGVQQEEKGPMQGFPDTKMVMYEKDRTMHPVMGLKVIRLWNPPYLQVAIDIPDINTLKAILKQIPQARRAKLILASGCKSSMRKG